MIIESDSYQIYTGNIDIFDNLTSFTKNYSKVFVLVDENTRIYCYPVIKKYLENISDIYFIQIKSGENNKNLDTCQTIWKVLTENKADRKSLLINLGGGVIGDMGGFCASTYKRGIDFVNIPTTLLSQVDASVGGKLGIDFMGLKNQIGLFNNPKYVFVYPDFIKTLNNKEKMSGFAEIIKHALIDDFDYWNNIQNIESLNWDHIINQSINIKNNIVKLDPEEKNIRKKLNFGHTIGHAIESYSLINDIDPLSHGHSVAIGMICECFLSNKINNLSDKELNEISNYIYSKYGNYKIDLRNFDVIMNFMKNDKKNDNEKINFTLLNSIGSSDINMYSDSDLIYKSIDYFNNL